jgi:hypothetical protein
MATWPTSRARLASRISARSACAIWVGQCVGVDLARAIKITAQMLTTQLVSQFTDLGGVVEVVTVVHHHRSGQVLEHGRFERREVAVAEQIVGVELGARDQQVLLGLLPARSGFLRPDPQRVRSARSALPVEARSCRYTESSFGPCS